MLAGNPSTQTDGFGSRFQYEESNYMVAEEMEEHALASAEAAYKYPGELTPIGFMVTGGVFHYENASHWWDKKIFIPQQNLLREH